MYYKDIINPNIRRIINNKNVDNLEINPSDLAIDVDTIATKLGLKIKYVIMDVLTDQYCDNLDEIINHKTITVNKNWPIEKQRFWIAHQIGHYCLAKYEK